LTVAYATADDVQARYEQDLDEKLTGIVNIRLNDAELLIKSKILDLDDQITSETLNVEVVKLVEAEMVLRLIRNPEGFSQESDGNYSYAIYQQVSSGKLEVLDNEWDLLGLSPGLWVLAPDIGADVGILPADPSLAWGINFPYWYPIGGDPNQPMLPGYP
jgi:hypothetical protein